MRTHTHTFYTLTSALRNDRHSSASTLICFSARFWSGGRESRMDGGRVPCGRERGWRVFLKWRSLQEKGQLAWSYSKKTEKCRILVWKVRRGMRSILGNRRPVLLSWKPWVGEPELVRSYTWVGVANGYRGWNMGQAFILETAPQNSCAHLGELSKRYLFQNQVSRLHFKAWSTCSPVCLWGHLITSFSSSLFKNHISF